MAPDLNRGLDDLVAALENPMWLMNRPGPVSFAALATAHERLEELGLLDRGEPTPYTHALYERRAIANFTPEERRMIRFQLGLSGEDTDG